jgi:hypothetical protein
MGILFKLGVLLVALSGSIGQDAVRPVFKVSGVVLYPDGKPSAGATVTGITACKQEPYRIVQTTKTTSDGSFDLQFGGTECDRIRLSARNIDELWLETGTNIFYIRENGTAPIVQVAADGSSTGAVINLQERGGLVEFRVRDEATERFIFAEVYLEKLRVSGASFGSMLFATGRDGSADSLFLPEGEYRFSVQQYVCNGADYFAASPVKGTFTVEAGQRFSKDFSLDVRQIKPLKSSRNPHGKLCVPTPH